MLFLISDWNSPFHNLLLSPIHSLYTSEKSLVQISLQPCYSFCKVCLFIPEACRYTRINLQGQKWGTEAAACLGTLPSVAGLEVLSQSSTLDEFPEKCPLPTLLNHSAKLFNHFSLDCTEILVSMKCLYSCTSSGDLMFPSLYSFHFAEKALGVMHKAKMSWQYVLMAKANSNLGCTGKDVAIRWWKVIFPIYIAVLGLGSVWGSPVWDMDV